MIDWLIKGSDFQKHSPYFLVGVWISSLKAAAQGDKINMIQNIVAGVPWWCFCFQVGNIIRLQDQPIVWKLIHHPILEVPNSALDRRQHHNNDQGCDKQHDKDQVDAQQHLAKSRELKRRRVEVKRKLDWFIARHSYRCILLPVRRHWTPRRGHVVHWERTYSLCTVPIWVTSRDLYPEENLIKNRAISVHPPQFAQILVWRKYETELGRGAIGHTRAWWSMYIRHTAKHPRDVHNLFTSLTDKFRRRTFLPLAPPPIDNKKLRMVNE